jgi:hypothetical protein
MYIKLGYAFRVLQQQKKTTFSAANVHGSLTLKGQMVVVKPNTKTALKQIPTRCDQKASLPISLH